MIGYVEYDVGTEESLLQAKYVYNSKGQLNTQEIGFSYTAQNTVESDWISYEFTYQPYSSNVQADGGDMLSSMTLRGGSGAQAYISYTYDNLYRMTGKSTMWNNSLNMSQSYTYADKTAKATTRIGSFTSTVGTTSSSYSYTYDSFGNIQTITDSAGLVTRYYYDNQQQLIRENNPYTNTTYVYTYDRGGNRTSKTTYDYTTGSLTGSSGNTTNYTYDGDRLTAIGSTAITYDALGNPLTYGSTTYTWQNGRQLASINYNGGDPEYSFEYNDSGIRTSKTVNGIKHIYTLNGSQIVTESWTQNNVEHVIVYLYDESGAPIGMKYRTSAYAWDEFDNFFFEKNLFGDIVAVYNESGNKIGSYKYDAWGICTASVQSTASTFEQNVVRDYNPFRYRGYYYDTETGFYYLQSRYYDPVTGRFLNVDGYINANGDLIGYNMYAYCSNNPIIYVDPTGYAEVDIKDDEDGNPFNDFGPVYTGTGNMGYGGGGHNFASYYDSTAYNTYSIRTYTAYSDGALGGYYTNAPTHGMSNYGYYNVPGAVTVTDDMAVNTQKRGWKVGDDIRNLTKDGKIPSWTTVYQRYWKNQAHYHPELYSDDDLALMRQGRAPKVNGRPLHLHHPYGREGANFWVFYPVTYEQHHLIHYGW